MVQQRNYDPSNGQQQNPEQEQQRVVMPAAQPPTEAERDIRQLYAGLPPDLRGRVVATPGESETVVTVRVPNRDLRHLTLAVARPAADPAPAPTTDAAGPSPEQLLAELRELERQPAPADTAVAQRADCRWLQDHWITAELEPYRGETVVVLNGAVVAHGDNPHQLEIDVARRFGVHPYRLVVEYIPQWGEQF